MSIHMMTTDRRLKHPWLLGVLISAGLAALVYVVLAWLVGRGALPASPYFFVMALLLPFAFAVQTLTKLLELRENTSLSAMTSSAEQRRLREIVNSKVNRVCVLLGYYMIAAIVSGASVALFYGQESMRSVIWAGATFLFVLAFYSVWILVLQRREITDFIATLNERAARAARKSSTLKRLRP